MKRLMLVTALGLALAASPTHADDRARTALLTRLVLADAAGAAKLADAKLTDLYYLASVTMRLDKRCPLTDRGAIEKASRFAGAMARFESSLSADALMAMLFTNAADEVMSIYLAFNAGAADLDTLMAGQGCDASAVKSIRATLPTVWAMFVPTSN